MEADIKLILNKDISTTIKSLIWQFEQLCLDWWIRDTGQFSKLSFKRNVYRSTTYFLTEQGRIDSISYTSLDRITAYTYMVVYIKNNLKYTRI